MGKDIAAQHFAAADRERQLARLEWSRYRVVGIAPRAAAELCVSSPERIAGKAVAGEPLPPYDRNKESRPFSDE